MEGVTKNVGASSRGCGADGAEASWQASQGDDRWDYEVFLSFRGADTRKGFTGHLYETLVANGVSTFIDNEELKKGERVDKLFSYIERSRMFVPIFSEHYADSTWCLREIAKIVECGRLIIPVFFGVEPSDVRYQTGPFQEAFKKHENSSYLTEEEVNSWKDALFRAAQLSGFNLKDANFHEVELKKCIWKRIAEEVNPRCLDVGEHCICTGLEPRVNEVIKLLDAEGGMVGIWGMGGIGKTTLAKAVYNRLCSSFDSCSFLANVREASEPKNIGIIRLQEQLLRDVLGSEVRINNRDDGIAKIRKRIGKRKVLIVIDDVDNKDQVYALAGSRPFWFSGESRMIVTSRDETIFDPRKNAIYRLPELDPAISLQLFSLHAFGQSEPKSDWKELSKKVVSFADGIPLCLQVFGGLFYDVESIEEWESKLEQLKRDQYEKVHEKLKISYDYLQGNAKRIFLDIACFSMGSGWETWAEKKEKKEYAMLMWEGSKLYPRDAIPDLQRRSLIIINKEHGTFEMHDQIRDMGRKIVQQQWPPSRFWENNETTIDLLQTEQLGTPDIEGIIFQRLQQEEMPQQEMPPLNTMSFRKMVNLRILDMGSVRLEGSYHNLPRSLKFLTWWQCPLKSLPIDFHVVNIVVLDLTESKIEQFLGPSVTANLWPFGYFLSPIRYFFWPFGYLLRALGYFQPQEASYSRTFSQLKVLILKDCRNLKSTPDFRLIPNAAKLVFEGCTNLGRVHESIGDLQSLVCLNLRGCRSLKKIPDSICRLSSLKTLDLRDCETISTLPEKLGDLLSLEMLSLGGRQLQALPDISNLDALRSLQLTFCRKLMDVPGLAKLRRLEYLDLEGSSAALCDVMKEAKFEDYISLRLPGRRTSSPLTATPELWLVTISFLLPNVARLGTPMVMVQGRWATLTLTVNQVKADRHDNSSIIFERAEGERLKTEPEELIRVSEAKGFVAFVPPKPKVEDEKGEGYRMIEVTFEAGSDLSGCYFSIELIDTRRRQERLLRDWPYVNNGKPKWKYCTKK